MKRAILAAAALMAASGMAGAASAQAVKPPMSPELQKIVDGAKIEKVLLSSTNPLVFGGQANLDAAKAWIKENFGVDIEFNVTNGGPFGIIGAKISTEFRANQPSSVDIWTAGIAQYDPLLKLNMFTQVPWQKLWPERIVPQQIGADGYSLGISTGTPGVLYNVACLYSLIGKPQDALAHLESAIQHGFGDRLSMANDPDLDLVRRTPWFGAIAHAMTERRSV